MSKTKKHAGGRPSKITGINLKEVTYQAEKGYTDKQLGKIFNVDQRTIDNWKKDYPEFFQSLKKGKLLADAKVEASLYLRACGYSHPEVHITNYLGSVTLTPIIKHYPPDPTSMIFWLKNRKPNDWRDKQDIEHTIKEVLYAENEGKSYAEIEREANELGDALLAKRKGVVIPEEN